MRLQIPGASKDFFDTPVAELRKCFEQNLTAELNINTVDQIDEYVINMRMKILSKSERASIISVPIKLSIIETKIGSKISSQIQVLHIIIMSAIAGIAGSIWFIPFGLTNFLIAYTISVVLILIVILYTAIIKSRQLVDHFKVS